jgi:hypothetical protein
MAEWHVRQAGSRPIGPVSTELVIRGIEAGKVALDAEVCRVGSRDWMPIDMVDEFAHVAVDEEAATRVTESPWFADQPSQPRIAPPPAPKPSSSLGLPQAPAPALRSSPRIAPPAPPRSSAPHIPRVPPPRAPPPPPPVPMAAQNPYGEVDDETMTNVVASPLDAGVVSYECDDETMTRVAAPRGPAPPIGAPEKKPGLLKTAPMWAGDMPDIPPVRPAAGEPASRRLPAPRPAAGAPPDSAIEVHPDLLAGPPEMPPAPPGFGPPGFPPPQQSFDVARFAPTMPAAGPPPPAPYPAPQHPQAQPLHPGPLPARGTDSGVKALIALIALLFLALMTVLILLVLRR